MTDATTRRCLLSLRPLADGENFDRGAALALFGTPKVPTIDVQMAKLHTLGLAMVGKASMSGVQRKLSLRLDAEKMALKLLANGLQYIVKPPSDRFPALPENEHVTMHMAALCGLDVPPHGLITLQDGAIAYIIRRFDRRNDGGKLRMEDFCQLSSVYPAGKYRGSAEKCARIVRQFASEPLIALRDLFAILLFGWWTGNGDLHLKNLSLLTDIDGLHRMSPVYDLLCTRLVIDNDPLALPLAGKRDGITAKNWREFAEYCGLPKRSVARLARRFTQQTDACLSLVAASFLPDAQKQAYAALLSARAPVIAQLAGTQTAR